MEIFKAQGFQVSVLFKTLFHEIMLFPILLSNTFLLQLIIQLKPSTRNYSGLNDASSISKPFLN